MLAVNLVSVPHTAFRKRVFQVRSGDHGRRVSGVAEILVYQVLCLLTVRQENGSKVLPSFCSYLQILEKIIDWGISKCLPSFFFLHYFFLFPSHSIITCNAC